MSSAAFQLLLCFLLPECSRRERWLASGLRSDAHLQRLGVICSRLVASALAASLLCCRRLKQALTQLAWLLCCSPQSQPRGRVLAEASLASLTAPLIPIHAHLFAARPALTWLSWRRRQSERKRRPLPPSASVQQQPRRRRRRRRPRRRRQGRLASGPPLRLARERICHLVRAGEGWRKGRLPGFSAAIGVLPSIAIASFGCWYQPVCTRCGDADVSACCIVCPPLHLADPSRLGQRLMQHCAR